MSKSYKKTELQFFTILSFAQELRETPLGSGYFIPASNTIPDPQSKGICKLYFSEDFETLRLKLKIYGNQKIILSHLHLDDPSATGPLTVSLFPNKKAIIKNKNNNNFSLKIELTNDDVIPRNNKNNFSTNTIASLYNAIRGNNLYVDVHGEGDYLLGMLRGQFYLSQ